MYERIYNYIGEDITDKRIPKFSSPGGAIQFMHYQPIKFECEQGKLKEEKSWRQENI